MRETEYLVVDHLAWLKSLRSWLLAFHDGFESESAIRLVIVRSLSTAR